MTRGIDDLRRRAEEVPDRSANQRNDDHRRNKYGGDFIRQLADLRFAALRLAHHADNSCQRGLAADGAGGKQHAAILHHGPGVNGVAIAFCCGTGSPVSIASSNRGFATAYHAVDRDAVAGSQAQRHAGLNFRERQIFLALGRDDPRRRRRQVEQFFQR